MTLLNIFRPNDSKNISAYFLFLKLKLNRKLFFLSNFSLVFFCRSIFSAVEPKKFGPVSVRFGLMPFGPTPSCPRARVRGDRVRTPLNNFSHFLHIPVFRLSWRITSKSFYFPVPVVGFFCHQKY